MAPLQRITAPTVEVLQLLLAADGPVWGLRIVKEIGRPSGTVYPILTRLEEGGWLAAEWEADSERGGPRRRLYELTAEGATEGAKVVDQFRARQESRAIGAPRPATGGQL